MFLPSSASRVAFQVSWGLNPPTLGTVEISDWNGGTVPAIIPSCWDLWLFLEFFLCDLDREE